MSKKIIYNDYLTIIKGYLETHKNLNYFKLDYPDICEEMRRNKEFVTCLDKIYGDDFDYSYLFENIPHGFWTEKRILKKIENIYINDGVIILKKYPKFSGFIYKNKKTLKYYIEKLGYKYNDVCKYIEPHYYDSWDVLKKDILKIITENNNLFPSTEMLNERGISKKILAKHGGVVSVRKKMGYTKGLLKAEDGHYVKSNPELIVDNALFHNKILHKYDGKIIDNLKDIPVKYRNKKNKYRFDFYCSEYDIYIEVWGMDKGNSKINIEYREQKRKKLKFYDDCNLKLIELCYEDFENIDKLINYILPQKIKQISNMDIVDVVSNKELLIPDYLINKENFLEKIAPLLIDGICIPSETQLRKLDRWDLITYIYKHGGYKKTAKEHNLKTYSEHNGYCENGTFTNDRVLDMLLSIYTKEGYIPSSSKLDKKLQWALVRLGGYTSFCSKHNLVTENELINWSDKRVRDELLKLYNINGYIPYITALDDDLVRNIKRIGGYKKVCKDFGFITETEYNKIKKEETKEEREDLLGELLYNKLIEIYNEKGYIPFITELNSTIRSRLSRYGGVEKFCSKYNLLTKEEFLGDKPNIKWDIEKAQELLNNNVSYKDISLKLGISYGVVNASVCKGFLVKPKDYNSKKSGWDIEKAQKLLNEGDLSYVDIGKEVGATYNEISYAVKCGILTKPINRVSKNSVKIVKLNLEGNLISEYDKIPCIKGYSYPSISLACSGSYGSNMGHEYKGYLWYYKKDYDEIKIGKDDKLLRDFILDTQTKIKERQKKSKKIVMIDEVNNEAKEYNMIKDVVLDGFSEQHAGKACKGKHSKQGHKYKKYLWYYKSDYEEMMKDSMGQVV